MDVEVVRDELRVAGTPVLGRRSLVDALGPPDRSVASGRSVQGVEGPGEHTVDVWDELGLMAGEDWIAVAVGPNVLDEPIWPERTHEGRIVIDGDDLVHVALAVDPLREDRRVAQFGSWAITLVVDWDGSAGKLLVRRSRPA